MNDPLNFALLYSHRLAIRYCRRRRQPLRLPEQASFTEKFFGPQKCDNGFLSFLGDDGDFDLALLDIEDGVRIIALSENDFSL